MDRAPDNAFARRYDALVRREFGPDPAKPTTRRPLYEPAGIIEQTDRDGQYGGPHRGSPDGLFARIASLPVIARAIAYLKTLT